MKNSIQRLGSFIKLLIEIFFLSGFLPWALIFEKSDLGKFEEESDIFDEMMMNQQEVYEETQLHS